LFKIIQYNILINYFNGKEEKPVEELEQGESSRKRKASTDELNQPVPKKLKIVPYQLDSHIKALIKKDVLNKRNWETANDALKLGYPVIYWIHNKIIFY